MDQHFMCRHFCVWLSLFISLPLFSQDTTITLRELVLKVDAYAPSLQSDAISIQISKEKEKSNRAGMLPNLKLNFQIDAGTNNNLPGGYFSYGIVPGNSRVRDEYNGSTILTDLGIASFDWEVYNFGGFAAQQKLVQTDVTVEKWRYAQNRFQLEAFTIGCYLQLLRLKELTRIQSMNIERNNEIRRSIQALAENGIIAGVDTSIAEAELSKAKLILLELSNQSKQLQLQLSAISGVNPKAILPDTTLTDHLMEYYQEIPLNDADTANHPAVGYYKSLVENSLAREELVKKSYHPKVFVQAALWGRGSSVSARDEFRALSKGLGFERGNYLVGVGISYNLFDIKRKNLQLSVQRAGSELARQKLIQQQTELTLTINQAEEELKTARERLQEIPKQLEAAQAAYRQKLSLYKNGLTNIVDLNAALNILYRAETDYTNAHYLYSKSLFQKALNENQIESLLNTLN